MSQVLVYNSLLIYPDIQEKIEKISKENKHIIYHQNCETNKIPFLKFKFDILRENNWHDRTGSYPHFLNLKTSDSPLPKLGVFSKSLERIVLDRAKDILNQNKYINLLWSGGIDSTLIFSALRKEIQNKDQLKITCTYNSIFESGSFFDKYIKNEFEYDIKPRQLLPKPYDFKFDSDIILTGSLGDHLTGSISMSDCIVTNFQITRKDKTKPSKEKIMSEIDEKIENVLSKEYYEFYLPIFQNFEVEINTMKDFYWFFLFVCGWCSAKHRLKFRQSLKYISKYQSFFDNDDFQRWSMYVKGGMHHSFHPDWKIEFKNFIDDKGYFQKTKGHSSFTYGPTLIPTNGINNILCLIEDGTNYIHFKGNINGVKY